MPPRMDRTSRPEGWAEVTAKLDRGEITQVEAAKILGIHRNKLNMMLNWDNPNRRDRRKEMAKKMGKANGKYTTVLEQNFTDYTMCKMIRMTENCNRCPMNCDGEKRFKGLVKKLLEKIPLKSDGKDLLEHKTGIPDPDAVRLQMENYRKALKAAGKDLEER